MQVRSTQEVRMGLGGSASNYVCRVHGPWGFMDPRKFTEESPCHLLWAMLELLSVSWPLLDRYASASDEELVTLLRSYTHLGLCVLDWRTWWSAWAWF